MTQGQSEPPVSKRLAYARTGGIAGFNDIAIIEPNGTVEVRGRPGGLRRGQLDDQEISQLRAFVQGFETTAKPRWKLQPMMMDALHVSICYGRSAVDLCAYRGAVPQSLVDMQNWLEDLIARLPVPFCPKCGYNLTGNVSGVCPECGRPIAGQTPPVE